MFGGDQGWISVERADQQERIMRGRKAMTTGSIVAIAVALFVVVYLLTR